MHFYFAGADDKNLNWALDVGGATHRLTTYFILDGALAKRFPSQSIAVSGSDERFLAARDKAVARALKMVRDNTVATSWVIDSGAFTYQKQENRVPTSFLMKYAERYIDFCKQAGDKFDWCAEMDVERVYGMKFVEEVWEKMQDAGLRGLRVWHPTRGADAFKDYCRDYEHIGIGSSYLHEDDTEALLRYGYANGNKIHVFGVLRNTLVRWPCYSADATTWIAPFAWREMVKFDRAKGRLVRIRPNKDGIQLAALDAVADARMEGRYKAAALTVREFLAYEDYLTRSWKERGVSFEEQS